MWSRSLSSLALLLTIACGEKGPGSEGQGTSGTETDTNTGPLDLGCSTDEPFLQASGAESGFYACDDRFLHRVAPATCEVPAPPETCESTAGGTCTTSAECNAQPHGACLTDGVGDPAVSMGCNCVYSCETDADCGAGNVCACIGERPICVPAACSTDADCGGLCVLNTTYGACGNASHWMVCLEPEHECLPGLPGTCPPVPDCNGGMSPPPCIFTNEGWACGAFDNCGTSCG